MDLDLRPYRSFLRIAELGSFNRAAETLAVTQPALSAQIRELERRLGFAVFRRHNRRVSLTPEGRLFLDRARRLIMEVDWLNQTARDIRENRLRIGVAHHSGSIPERCTLIERFMIGHPNMPVSILNRAHAQLFSDLRSGEIDVGITIELAGVDVESVVEPSEHGIDRLVVAKRRLRVATPAGHRLARRPLGPGTLRGVEIATIGRAHGVALSEYLNRRIVAGGSVSRSMPEGDAQSVMRYGAALGIAAIDLGWFPNGPSIMESEPAADFDIHTQLVVISAAGDLREGAAAFLAHCAERAVLS